MPDSWEVGSGHCPRCHKNLEGAGTIDDDQTPPKAGDFTVCMYCGIILAFHDTDRGLVAQLPCPCCDLKSLHDQPGLREKLFEIVRLVSIRIALHARRN